MKFHNLRELAPISLISVLLFVSCTQLPIEDEPAGSPVQDIPQALALPVSEADPIADAEAEQLQTALESAVVIEQNQQTAEESSTALVTEEVTEESVPMQDEPADMTETLHAEDELIAASPLPIGAPDGLSEEGQLHQRNIEVLCREIGEKLGSVSIEDCLTQKLEFAGAYSVNDRPLASRDFLPRTESGGETRILIMGGIHGDEYSSISIMFKWMNLLRDSGGNNFTWRFLPAVNPDGLLDGQANRQNASGVDLNRNFPSQDWEQDALDYWRNSTGENPRRFPGEQASSEPEVRWIIEQIENFDPEVIVSVHAPYHLLDFDGPSVAPEKIGDLYLHELGVYPGSLGNYAGLDLGIPVVTLELPSAGIMPPNEQIETMWIDILNWLNTRTHLEQNAAL